MQFYMVSQTSAFFWFLLHTCAAESWTEQIVLIKFLYAACPAPTAATVIAGDHNEVI